MRKLLIIAFASLVISDVALSQAPADGKGRALAASSSVSKSVQGFSGLSVPCEDGLAIGFPCRDVTLHAFMTLDELGPGDIEPLRANDIWGWTDPETGEEYALVGRNVGTSFVNVTNPTEPVLVGNLPRTPGARASVWRDIKVYANYAFVVSDGAGDHGMQVFDLTRLRNVTNRPAQFRPDALYIDFGSAHNVVVNTETGYAYAVGSSASGQRKCGGGLHMIDIRNPLTPTFAGCFSDPATGFRGAGYTHDAQCVTYRGPDIRYHEHEICFGLNENAISIADVTDKSNPVAVSVGRYPDFSYVHQGWLTADQRYLIVDDEGDERAFSRRTHSKVFDVADLEVPIMVSSFENVTTSTDHNLYVAGLVGYQANYTAGLRILDVRDPLNIEEIGYFDTTPSDNTLGFRGTWSVYPFFESGTIVVSSINEGLFVLESARLELVIPEETGVSEAWPNPFNARTNLAVAIVEPEEVSVVIYDPLGRIVETLHNGPLSGNRVHEFIWDSGQRASGAYIIRILGESFEEVRSVTLLK
jgi:choice-of-anchor B domain-containing protein